LEGLSSLDIHCKVESFEGLEREEKRACCDGLFGYEGLSLNKAWFFSFTFAFLDFS